MIAVAFALWVTPGWTQTETPSPATTSPAEKPSSRKPPAVKHSRFVPKGYTLTFHDEFDGRELDLEKWNYRQLGERDGTVLVEETVSLDGRGNLLLAVDGKGADGVLRCSMVSTEKSFLQRYGYFESRIRFQRPQGLHGGFWLQSPTYGKVRDDLAASGVEIDIVEFFGAGRTDGGTSAALHWNGYAADHRTVSAKAPVAQGLARFAVPGRPKPELCDAFHVFGMEWVKEGYRFHVDGAEFYRTAEAVSHRDEYVILSLLSSAGERTRLDWNTLPATMAVDYVRVYAR